MNDTNIRRVAVLGLGAMGRRMAQNLLDAGYETTVWNRTPERAQALVEGGATLAPSPRDAAEGAQLVFAMVTDDDASRAAWDDERRGALLGLEKDAIAVESSTLTPERAVGLAEKVAARGARFLDAPVVGSRPQAEAGQLIYLAGGDAATFAAARPVLETMGGVLHHVGDVGHGMWMKLVVNALFGVQVAAAAELLGMLRGAGIDEGKAVETLAAMPVLSPALQGVSGLMARRAYAPMFPIDLVEKDLGYAADAAASVDAALPTVKAVRGVYGEAIRLGFGDDNIAGVAQVFGLTASA